MDGAWALYEAWVKIQCGEIDSALIFGFGRSSMGETAETLILQLDPYTVAPLGPDAISMAALQARALLDQGLYSERDMAEVAARNRRDAKSNPDAQLAGDFDVDAILAEPYLVDAAAQARLPADQRRGRGHGHRGRRARREVCDRSRSGSAASSTGWTPTSRVCATSRARPRPRRQRRRPA